MPETAHYAVEARSLQGCQIRLKVSRIGVDGFMGGGVDLIRMRGNWLLERKIQFRNQL